MMNASKTVTDRYLLNPVRFGRHSPSADDGSPLTLSGLAVTDDADLHLRDKIIAVLFTRPGERVNQPRFGVGLDQAVFEGLNPLTLAALEFRITQGLHNDVGEELAVNNVEVTTDEATGQLLISIEYIHNTNRQTRTMEIRL